LYTPTIDKIIRRKAISSTSFVFSYVENDAFDSPEVTQLSTSENIFSFKFIVLLFAHEGQKVFEPRQDAVGRGDTILHAKTKKEVSKRTPL
jgi:hypothetical protein